MQKLGLPANLCPGECERRAACMSPLPAAIRKTRGREVRSSVFPNHVEVDTPSHLGVSGSLLCLQIPDGGTPSSLSDAPSLAKPPAHCIPPPCVCCTQPAPVRGSSLVLHPQAPVRGSSLVLHPSLCLSGVGRDPQRDQGPVPWHVDSFGCEMHIHLSTTRKKTRKSPQQGL